MPISSHTNNSSQKSVISGQMITRNHLYTSYETSVACVPGAHAAHPCTRTSAMATCFAAESDTPLGIKELATAFYGGELRL